MNNNSKQIYNYTVILEKEEQRSKFRKLLTVILIAHRLSTLEEGDRIFQLDQGQVCQEGDRHGDSPTNSATGGVVGATVGTDPAIVSTSIRSTG
ncbi:hypothetical protein [Cylindrospermopsis raciborskii]|uniref:hypothetical protein n=1 Tax=Cylindrospermopsis raciborskii TaxID=77022 RepID=UPI000C9DB4F2|nr:hypothetical protein [Cylindrospermopsis raciborskii]